MSEEKQPESNLAAEFRQLGENLTRALRATWDSPERRRIQDEISRGLSTLGDTIKNGAQEFGSTNTGQRLKSDVADLRGDLRTGEDRLRQELLKALRTINTDLGQTVDRWAARSSQQSESGPGESSGQQAMPEHERAGDTDRSSGDPQSEKRQEIHSDDTATPPSNTGHREINPDDVDV